MVLEQKCAELVRGGKSGLGKATMEGAKVSLRDVEGGQQGAEVGPAVADRTPDNGNAVRAHSVGEEVAQLSSRDSLRRLSEAGEPGGESEGQGSSGWWQVVVRVRYGGEGGGV